MSSNDSLKNIIGIALGVCLVCSLLVAAATVLLQPRQEANQRLEKLKNILIAGDLMKEKDKGVNVEGVFAEKIQPALIDLKTGERLPKEKMTGDLAPEKFDIKKIAKTPATSRLIPGDKDEARIKRMPTEVLVYFVKDNDSYSKIIFPVYGSGLWSVLYGFMALDRDLLTVRGFTIYEHGETPGLGGEVDNPRWKDSWKGKIAFNQAGQFELRVIKGTASPGSNSEIDGLSGATLTTRGVDHMIAFWFGPDGYGPFLENLRKEQAKEGTHE
jgi:Na+-transporting NADH:ubiquinone oxidoreductase subunit C